VLKKIAKFAYQSKRKSRIFLEPCYLGDMLRHDVVISVFSLLKYGNFKHNYFLNSCLWIIAFFCGNRWQKISKKKESLFPKGECNLGVLGMFMLIDFPLGLWICFASFGLCHALAFIATHFLLFHLNSGHDNFRSKVKITNRKTLSLHFFKCVMARVTINSKKTIPKPRSLTLHKIWY
jgi:hypothetical protein